MIHNKNYNYYPKGLKIIIVNFLVTNISSSNITSEFFHNIELYCINLATRIDKSFNQMLIALNLVFDL